MCSKVVGMLLAVFCIGCVFPEVTHMPPPKEVTLRPDIVLALKGKPMHSNACLESTHTSMKTLFQHIPPVNGFSSSYSIITRGPSPCEKCRMLRNELLEFYINDVATYVLAKEEYSYLKNISFGLPVIHTHCEKCRLTDDDGVEYVGEINGTWVNPQLRIIGIIEDTSDYHNMLEENVEDYAKLVFVNVTSVKEKKVNCKGGEKFEDICNRLHRTGELGHIFHAIIETLFKGKADEFEGVTEGEINAFVQIVNSVYSC